MGPSERGGAVVATACLLALVTGCIGAQTPSVARHLDGERRVGQFVSPHSYEWFVRGELAREQGDLARAAEAYALARTGAADDPLLIARHAEALEATGRQAEADEVLADGVRLFPSAEAVWMAAGRIAELRGRKDEAVIAYVRACRSAPRSELGPIALSRLLTRLGKRERADEVLRGFIARVEQKSAPALRARLHLAIQRGDAAAAQSIAQTLLMIAPTHMEEIGQVLTVALESDTPALAAQLVETLPTTPRTLGLKVEAWLAAGRIDEAEAALIAVPQGAESSEVGLRSPPHAEAADPFLEGTATAQQLANLWLRVGRPDRAAVLSETALASAPAPATHMLAAQARYALGDLSEAVKHLREIPRGAADYGRAQHLLVEVLCAGGYCGEAREALAQRRPSRGRMTAQQRTLLRLRNEQGDAYVTVAELKDSVARNGRAGAGDSPSTHERAAYAHALEWLGRMDDAAKLFRALEERDAGPWAPRVRAEKAAARGDVALALGALAAYTEAHEHDLAARVRWVQLLRRVDETRAARETDALIPLVGDSPLGQALRKAD